MVRARLERDVEDRAARRLACLLERDHLGVADAAVLVPALPHDLVLAHDDGSDEGMVACLAPTALGELERAHEVGHPSLWASPRYAPARSSRPKTAEPATRSVAPAACAGPMVSSSIPPSTWT